MRRERTGSIRNTDLYFSKSSWGTMNHGKGMFCVVASATGWLMSCRYWARSFIGWPSMEKVQPNRTHKAVSQLWGFGLVSHVITQSTEIHPLQFRTNLANCQISRRRFPPPYLPPNPADHRASRDPARFNMSHLPHPLPTYQVPTDPGHSEPQMGRLPENRFRGRRLRQ